LFIVSSTRPVLAARAWNRSSECAISALIAWSRVQVGDHTPAQVLAGVALGVVVNATIFPLLR
jgi:membrane-associated phospholipid phosphatase